MWTVSMHPEFESWIRDENRETQESIWAAVKVLAQQGPNLGRPLVDSIKGSRIKNLKELRPPSPGRTEIRVLFAFDKQRIALLLVGGNKAQTWSDWYPANIRLAELRFEELQ